MGFYSEYARRLDDGTFDSYDKVNSTKPRCRPGSGHSPKNDCGCWAGVRFGSPPKKKLSKEETTPDPYHYLVAARLVHEGYVMHNNKQRILQRAHDCEADWCVRKTDEEIFMIKVFVAFKQLTRTVETVTHRLVASKTSHHAGYPVFNKLCDRMAAPTHRLDTNYTWGYDDKWSIGIPDNIRKNMTAEQAMELEERLNRAFDILDKKNEGKRRE